MKRTLNPLIKEELENLQLKYGDNPVLSLDNIAEIFHIGRRKASEYVHKHGIPYTQTGKTMTFSVLDIAEFRAQRKVGRHQLQIVRPSASVEEMKNRRGFRRQALDKQLII